MPAQTEVSAEKDGCFLEQILRNPARQLCAQCGAGPCNEQRLAEDVLALEVRLKGLNARQALV